MRRFLWCPCLLLLLTALAAGQTLTIQVSAQSEPYTQIDVQATKDLNFYRWLIWTPSGEPSSQLRRTGPAGSEICFTGPPGRYRIYVSAFTGPCESPTELSAEATTVIGEAPGPDPLPPPPSNVAAVVIVIESSQQTPSQAAVILDKVWRTYLSGRKIPFRVVDPDVKDETGRVPSDLAPSLSAAKVTPGPDVCFVGADGSVTCKSLPAIPADMLELLKRIGGK